MTLDAVSVAATADPADPAASPHIGRTVGAGGARFITGEAISLDMPVARLGSRMLARTIDMIIQIILFITLEMVIGATVGLAEVIGLVEFDGNLYQALAIILAATVLVGYPVTMEALARGRTIGKLALGLRVVRDDGGPIRFRQALTRGLVGTAIEWPGLILPPLTWLACLWTMAASQQGKRLGDYAAGTLVIHDRISLGWRRPPLMLPGLIGWASTLDLTGLDDDLALAVRHFLLRMHSLREPARSRLAQRLMAEVAAVTRPAPPPGLPVWAYLTAVHVERTRRNQHQLAVLRPRSVAVWDQMRSRRQ